MKRRYLQIILAAVLFLLALGLTLYPMISNYYNQRHQSQIQTAYREVLEQTDTAELKRIREQAAAYNAAITPGAAEKTYTQESIIAASEDYANQLDLGGTGIMGYVVIPKIDVDLPIYHGTGSDSLDRGTGICWVPLCRWAARVLIPSSRDTAVWHPRRCSPIWSSFRRGIYFTFVCWMKPLPMK